jgi:hypothetical protein
MDDKDRLLDEALKAYVSQEPWPGLEERVLNRVRSAPKRRRFVWLRFALPLAAAACLWLLFMPRHEPAPPQTAAVVVEPALVERVEPQPPVVVHPKRALQKRPRYPKLDQFPAPAPLTEEERALLQLVRTEPEVAQAVAAQMRDTEDLHVEPIKIAPLSNGG